MNDPKVAIFLFNKAAGSAWGIAALSFYASRHWVCRRRLCELKTNYREVFRVISSRPSLQRLTWRTSRPRWASRPSVQPEGKP